MGKLSRLKKSKPKLQSVITPAARTLPTQPVVPYGLLLFAMAFSFLIAGGGSGIWILKSAYVKRFGAPATAQVLGLKTEHTLKSIPYHKVQFSYLDSSNKIHHSDARIDADEKFFLESLLRNKISSVKIHYLSSQPDFTAIDEDGSEHEGVILLLSFAGFFVLIVGLTLYGNRRKRRA